MPGTSTENPTQIFRVCAKQERLTSPHLAHLARSFRQGRGGGVGGLETEHDVLGPPWRGRVQSTSRSALLSVELEVYIKSQNDNNLVNNGKMLDLFEGKFGRKPLEASAKTAERNWRHFVPPKLFLTIRLDHPEPRTRQLPKPKLLCKKIRK